MSEDGNSRILPPEGGDGPSPSKHGTSRKRIKIIGPRESRQSGVRGLSEDGNSRHRSSAGGIRTKPPPPRYGPRVPTCSYFDGVCSKEDFAPWVEIALSHFNDSNRAEAPVYELVEILGGIYTPLECVNHFNFIARPKNGKDDENKLFFAEIKCDSYRGGHGRYCTCCCILGAPGSETGLGGCGLLCHVHPGHVQHPEAGFTKKLWFRR